MNLIHEIHIVEGNNLFEGGLRRNVFPVSDRLGFGRVVLQAADHFHDEVVAEKDVEEGRLVQIEQAAEDLEQVVEALAIFQVFAHVEELNEPLDVVLCLEDRGELFFVRVGLARELDDKKVADVLEPVEFTDGQVTGRRCVDFIV